MYSCKLKPAEHNFYPTTQYNLLPQTTSLHFRDTYCSSDSATFTFFYFCFYLQTHFDNWQPSRQNSNVHFCKTGICEALCFCFMLQLYVDLGKIS